MCVLHDADQFSLQCLDRRKSSLSFTGVGGSDALVAQVAGDVAAPLWVNASKHCDGKSLEEGGDMTCLKRHLHSMERRNHCKRNGCTRQHGVWRSTVNNESLTAATQ